MAANLTFSQSSYPIQKVIDGDTFVILRKSQADTINSIFESQKKKISTLRAQLLYTDSLLRRRDSVLVYRSINDWQYDALRAEYTNTLMFLDYVENWILDRAKEGAWLYYSYDSMWIEAVDLSEYKVRKDDLTGDIYFIRAENCPDLPPAKDNKDYPRRGWEKEVVVPNRPKINKL